MSVFRGTGCLVVALGLTLMFCRFRTYVKSFVPDVDGENDVYLVMYAITGALVFAYGVALICIAYTRMINPDYYAVSEILKAVAGMGN